MFVMHTLFQGHAYTFLFCISRRMKMRKFVVLVLFSLAFLVFIGFQCSYVSVRYISKSSHFGHLTITLDKGAQNCSKHATIAFDPYTLPGIPLRSFKPKYKNEQEDSCLPLKFSSRKFPNTALASHPGSGNTWTRFLIQQLTGEARILFYRCEVRQGSMFNNSQVR